MSVIVLLLTGLDDVRATLRALQKQTVKQCLELVIVAPESARVNLADADLQGFARVARVTFDPCVSTAQGRSAGVRGASAPIVAFVEEHSFPDPAWAEALLCAHRENYAAVGPAMANANPSTRVSWVNFLLEYGEWMSPIAAGVASHLPGHNGSYKRAVLLDYGDRLGEMLEAESVLQWDLRARGMMLYLESSARVNHLNVSRLDSALALRFNGGRTFAAARAHRWSVPHRALYAAGAPLIPFVRLFRIVRHLFKPGRPTRLLFKVLPLLPLLLIEGLGEMIGYATGAGDALARLAAMEFNRQRFLDKRDRVADRVGIAGE
jgi:hypothetical protein